MVIGLLIGLVVGVVAGAVAVVVLRGQEAARVATAEREHTAALAGVQGQLVMAQAELQAERAAAAQREAAWAEAQEQLKGTFAALSAQALQQNNAQFLELANARLKETQQAAQGDLEQRKQAIEQLLAPLREQLGKYEEGLRLLELSRQDAYSRLVTQVQALSDSEQRLQVATSNLVTALRAPSTRGRWG
jgi:DNA recombination protein RmuC